jgi:tRNA 2-selenouridine synthase SelU
VAQATAEKLARVYVKIREKRRELAKEDEKLEGELQIVADQLLEICKEQGAATIRTEHGTISRRLSKRYWTSNWTDFTQFVKQHDAFSLLTQRINNTNMAQFLEENPDLLPPGLNAEVTQTVVITKR